VAFSIYDSCLGVKNALKTPPRWNPQPWKAPRFRTQPQSMLLPQDIQRLWIYRAFSWTRHFLSLMHKNYGHRYKYNFCPHNTDQRGQVTCQAHTAGKWWSWDSNPDSLIPRAMHLARKEANTECFLRTGVFYIHDVI
jgi:hypothetical protein